VNALLRGGVWGGGASHQSLANDSLHTVRVRQHIVVPEPKHLKSSISKIRISRAVTSSAFVEIVLSAIDLDHEPCRIAGEVDDQVIDRYLAAKVKSIALERAQSPPELFLGFGRVAAKAARALVRH
jgi:hypothetical protein